MDIREQLQEVKLRTFDGSFMVWYNIKKDSIDSALSDNIFREIFDDYKKERQNLVINLGVSTGMLLTGLVLNILSDTNQINISETGLNAVHFTSLLSTFYFSAHACIKYTPAKTILFYHSYFKGYLE